MKHEFRRGQVVERRRDGNGHKAGDRAVIIGPAERDRSYEVTTEETNELQVWLWPCFRPVQTALVKKSA